MNRLDSFKEKLNTLATTFEKTLSSYDKFNPFRVMYKLTEEETLHSRFIAFMLDPNGSHKQNTTFLELFLKTLGLPEIDLEGVEVLPNEKSKSEYNYIDILIRNPKTKQAIIIENKIFAGDSDFGQSENIQKEYALQRKFRISL